MASTDMKVLAFTKGDHTVPSSNFRVWFLADYLRKEYGWEVDIFHSISYSFWSVSFTRFRWWRKIIRSIGLQTPDVVLIHKVHFPLDIVILVVLLTRVYRIPLVYDIDDPQWVHSWAQDFLVSRIAHRIFCSSVPFMEHYKKINPHVVYIPTVIDSDRYAAYKKISYRHAGSVVIGWVGDGPGHFKFKNFHILKPALERLGREGYHIIWRIIGTRGYEPLERFIRSDVYEVDLVPQVPFDEVPLYIQQFDIGVAPVQDIEWFRINATAKGVEYMACGVPIIASPVGAYRDLVQEGENGFLASTTDDWVEKIKRLLADQSISQKIGEMGLQTVRTKYSYASIVPIVKKEFETLCV
jgi:glycosyltransferase involved in cell wall biosynthesis